jgi:hypothetical protein
LRGLLIAGALAVASAAHAQETPKVLITSPQNGSTVPPSVAELKVTFDHQMAESWSFVTGGEKAFPEVIGNPYRSGDHITITLPIRLQPGHTYVVWLNSDRYKNFKDEDGNAAEPYRLTFSTTD